MAHSLNSFLAENERQAFRMAQLATGHNDDALDIVQDAMIKLVQKYGDRSSNEWGLLFHRIMQRQITDWYRKSSVKKRIFLWLSNDSEDSDGFLDTIEDNAFERRINICKQVKLSMFTISITTIINATTVGVFIKVLATKETASAVGCSTGSVKMHYHRALAKLQTQLGGTWP